MFFIEGMLT